MQQIPRSPFIKGANATSFNIPKHYLSPNCVQKKRGSMNSTPTAEKGFSNSIFNAAVIVAALGYFVDIYDLVLFSIVRVPSLKALGVEGARLLDDGIFLINMQMFGMLVGGVFWGILGDKKGRLSILFGSIITYSLANIANGFVQDLPTYAALRFIAGIGLAGELGAE
jgi:MFS transporter, putative metabolite:H+ symporter